MPTTTLGITYPASTDNVQLWTHLQQLAEDADGLIGDDRDRLDVLEDPGLTALTLQNGWVSWGSGFLAPSYTKVGSLVKLNGLAGGGAKTSNVIATLPSGYRPSAVLMFATAATDAFGAVTVNSSGEITFYAGTATWVSLDTVAFVVT
jgi:hypothetical protein